MPVKYREHSKPSKAIVFLADGMADEPLEELGGRTPLEAVDTPFMDSIAAAGASGTFLSLPEGFPTSSDAANMSVLGYDLATTYPGRGPIEAVAKDIALRDNDFAWRCNLVHADGGLLVDYSSGHIDNKLSSQILGALKSELDSEKITFHPGVSYRNILVLHGDEFSDDILYSKPDSSQGEPLDSLVLKPKHPGDLKALHTIGFLSDISRKASDVLKKFPLPPNLKNPPNMIWPWSPGRKPSLPPFSDLYGIGRAAVITAVDVVAGIAKCAKMDVIHVEGATGFIDTNYEGKAQAAIRCIDDYDFIYLHVEAIDECSHMGDMSLKMHAIKDFESRIVAPVLMALKGRDISFALLPDHPVPIKLRKHTRTPVPVAIQARHIMPDSIRTYSESQAPRGSLGLMRGDQFIRKLLFDPEVLVPA